LVEAYDPGTGAFSWRLGLPGTTLFAPVALRSEPLEILLSSPSGLLLVVSGDKGEILSEATLPFELALAPLPAGDTLYVGTPEGVVGALDFETKTERFRLQTPEKPSAFAVRGGLLVVSGAERTLTALDATTGDVRWTFRGRAGFSPAVFREPGDRLYVGDDAGEFYCLGAEKGNVRFRWSTGASIRAPALVVGNRVYVASFGNNLYAYDSGGGSEQWRTSLPGRPATGPVLVNRRLLVATLDGAFVEIALDRGQIGKTYSAPGELATTPAIWIASGSILPEPGETPVAAPNESLTDEPRSAPPVEVPETRPGEVKETSRGESDEIAGAPTVIPPYERHRIALTLRAGPVLLLGHQKPAPVEPEPATEESPPEKPPGERVP
jgi:outer membrane protein assembly factor BamB